MPDYFDTTARVPASYCLNCNYKLDACSGSRAPRANDITVCVSCWHVMVFDSDLTLRAPTEEEEVLIETDENLSQTIVQIQNRLRWLRAQN